MKSQLIFFIFFISSIILIAITVEKNAYGIYDARIKKLKLSKIQTMSSKRYKRTRKVYVPVRSYILAKKEIENILKEEPIRFEDNNSSLLVKPTLLQVAKIADHVNDNVILSIAAHTDTKGTAKHNLHLSQQRADRLKEYFVNNTNLPLVVAIGYGEARSLKNRLIEIKLKRIKQ